MDRRETGLAVLLFGAFFFVIGIILVMDKAMMAAGNILMVVGVVILSRTRMLNLFEIRNLQGTAIFCFGIFILFYKYVLLGFLIELIGLYFLFFDKIPTFKGIFRNLLGKTIRILR